MLAATSKFLRQIIPPVIATLIAAVLIAGFNRAFSTHLTQPRLGGLNAQADAESPGDRVLPRPVAARPAAATEVVEEPAPVREWQKGGAREAAKEPVGIRSAETAPVAPPAPVVARRPEARQVEARPVEARPVESRQVEARRVEPPVTAAPVAVAAPIAPVVIAAPAAPPVIAVPVAPPVVMPAPVRQEPVFGEPPMVTVPDRPRPQSQPQYAEPPAPPPHPQGPIGTIANTLNPSTWFARARELGEKIEAVGNDILPDIRQ